MRIISQDRTKSIEFDGTEVHLQYENIIYQSGLSKGKLGTYDGMNRAEEIFFDMHKQWHEDCMSVFEMPEK